MAIASGMTEKHPDRYVNRLQLVDQSELGAAPLYFDGMQREIWYEMVERLWWLSASDYAMVESACTLYAKMRVTQNDEVIMKLVNVLQKLGASPTARGNVILDRKGGDKKSRFK